MRRGLVGQLDDPLAQVCLIHHDAGLLEGSGHALEGGRIVADDDGRTALPRLYAGGDCRRGGRDLTVEAVADGRRAAAAIDADLKP